MNPATNSNLKKCLDECFTVEGSTLSFGYLKLLVDVLPIGVKMSDILAVVTRRPCNGKNTQKSVFAHFHKLRLMGRVTFVLCLINQST